MPNEQIAFNPLDYPLSKCTKCGNTLFKATVQFREVPGLVMGERDTQYYPIKVFTCTECGEISPLDQKVKADMERIYSGNKQDPASDLIIT
jgi:predicted nucleic acid-binding Zn ribbon protein